ncbi:hypothetical protein SteCoe_16609 [Stentor coeruleus]|uniref:PDEase domain-containing protein n=1 Tax=Stentor coeruleus TaxID=5963 RepID=A0A1R2C0W9_9CILI|nr:hypothetical protein SteCoe_16609 [Stentor coeruleus]
MGCFGSKSSKEVQSAGLKTNLIAANYMKLVETPSSWDQVIMKPLQLSIPKISFKMISPSLPEDVKDLNFPVFSRSPESLKESLFHIFHQRNYPSAKILSLIEIIAANYQQNPFHNFYHGFAVCQLLYVVSERNLNFKDFLTESDEKILLLSGLGHDLNHPGVNNMFLINSKHELACKYSNSGVLENYHAATLIEFLCQDRFDIGVSDEDRERIVQTILATDMAQHKLVMETFAENMKVYDITNKEHRLMFMRMLIHGADISNPALDFELATIWSLKIIQEFNLQVWKEEQLAIPVSEFMRIGNDIAKIKRSQIMFIDVFIYPLWKSISEFVPGTQELVENIQNNRKHWEDLENL